MSGIDPKFYYLTLGLLALCTIVGLIVAYSFQREVKEDLAPPTEKDVFDPIEKAYVSGLMNEDEYQRTQESLAKQMGRESKPNSKRSKPRPKPIEVAPPNPPEEPGPNPESDES